MLNMGGPAEPHETGPFLHRLFTDGDIIDLGGGAMQQWWGGMVAKRRTPRIQKQYEEIGGSPIRKWTEHQGEALAALLDKMRPASAPHKSYVAFRYAHPLTHEALERMRADGVERAVAFSQFPQWSCTTTGSSLNELWRTVKSMKLESAFKWSIIDRWPTHPTFVDAVVERIEQRLPKTPGERLPVIVFSAHSVPLKVVNKGDPYTHEVGATVRAVVDRLHAKGIHAKHTLAWQSKVGFLPWQGPATTNVIESLGKAGHQSVLVVPIAFTSDHIETLFELQIECRHTAEKAGIKSFEVTEGLNGSATFARALAEIAKDHLDRGAPYSPSYKLKCFGCDKPQCRGIIAHAGA